MLQQPIHSCINPSTALIDVVNIFPIGSFLGYLFIYYRLFCPFLFIGPASTSLDSRGCYGYMDPKTTLVKGGNGNAANVVVFVVN